jgi:phosphoribosylformylglycinamidine synthase
VKAIVKIALKQGVLDSQGKATYHTICTMGYEDIVKEITIGKLINIELDKNIDKQTAMKKVEKMCQELLVNTVIEDYSIDIV